MEPGMRVGGCGVVGEWYDLPPCALLLSFPAGKPGTGEQGANGETQGPMTPSFILIRALLLLLEQLDIKWRGEHRCHLQLQHIIYIKFYFFKIFSKSLF